MGFQARERLARQAREDGLFQDCAWCVFTADGMQEQSHAGPSPMDAVYDLASLTKPFTATAALAIGEERGLSLDAPLCSLPGGLVNALPERPSALARERLSAMTMRRLMTHTSGLQAWYPFYADGRPFWQTMADRLEAPPQTGMVYSDLNFMLMRELLCRITGLSYPDVIRQYVSRPLGLDFLDFAPLPEGVAAAPCCRDNAIEERMCRERGMRFNGFRPHNQTVCGQANDGNAFYYFHGVSGHAGLFGALSSVAGLGRFYLRREDPWFLQALEPQPGCEGRCVGFHTGGSFPTGCGHTGFTGTSLWIDRERGLGMVILTNRLMSPTIASPDLLAFRLSMHRTMLEAGE